VGVAHSLGGVALVSAVGCAGTKLDEEVDAVGTVASAIVTQPTENARDFRLRFTRVDTGAYTGQLVVNGTVNGSVQLNNVVLPSCLPQSTCQPSVDVPGTELFLPIPRDSIDPLTASVVFSVQSGGGTEGKVAVEFEQDRADPGDHLEVRLDDTSYDVCHGSGGFACSGLVGQEMCLPSASSGWGLCFVLEAPQTAPPVQRLLFVPWCWPNFVQQDFDDAVERSVNFFTTHSALGDCDENTGSFGTRKFEFLRAPAACLPSYDDILGALPNGLNSAELDAIVFVSHEPPSDPLPPGSLFDDECVAGSALAGGFLTSSTSAPTPYDGEYIVFAHEYGHAFLNLGEEYREPSSPGELAWPNRVRAELGCDPATCCTREHVCAEVYGIPLNGHVCAGNAPLDLEGWEWGDPAPVRHPDGGCIMSNASAPGWDAGDPLTGEGSHRSWCEACWAQWEVSGPRCSDTFTGQKNRLEVTGNLDVNQVLNLKSVSIGTGRVGPNLTGAGPLVIAVTNTSGTELGRMEVRKAGADPRHLSNNVDFWMRMPVASGVTLPLTLTVIDEGVPGSRVTAGGSVPTTIFGGASVECTGDSEASVTLDGSASSDPDGDSLIFEWSSPVPLTDAESATPTGAFPLGETAVSLTVSDGSGAGGTVSGTVNVTDTQAPAISLSEVAALPVCRLSGDEVLLPLPTALDACSGSVPVTGKVLASTNPSLTLPVVLTNGNATLPPGTHTVEWTATDSSGNTATMQQIVQVVPAVYATRSFDLRDRARITQGASYASVASSGTVTSSLGAEARLHDLLSTPTVDVRDRVIVHGDLRTAGSLTVGNQVVVLGATVEAQPLGWLPPAPAVSVSFPPVTGGSISISPYAIGSAAPGSYHTISVGAGATLNLTAGGSYYVRYLILEPQSVLIATSPVNLFVQTGLTYGGLFSGFQSSTVTYMGTSTLYLEAPASLSRLFVPAARLVVRGHLRAGQILARDLVVDPDRILECDPGLL
jgi:hypothetical protein